MVVERPYSVWESTDAEFLNWAIDFYLRQNAGDALILDATYGLGNFWRSPSDRFASQLTAIDIVTCPPKLHSLISWILPEMTGTRILVHP